MSDAFVKSYSESDELLRGILQSLFLAPRWSRVKASIAGQLRSFQPEEMRTKNLDKQLAQQLVLDIVGSEVRQLWGQQDDYDNSLLREPYLPKARRAELTNSISKQLTSRIDELLANSAADIEAMGYHEEAEGIINELIHYKRTRSAAAASSLSSSSGTSSSGTTSSSSSSALSAATAADGVFQDIVGKALVQTLRKHDFIIRLMSSTGSSPSDSVAMAAAAANRAPPSDSLTPTLEAMLSSDTNREVAEITEGYSARAISEICVKLRGGLLSDSLRGTLWAFAFLTRNYGEAPLGVSSMRELARLAQLKGYRIGDISSSPIADLVSRAVSHGMQQAFRTSMQSLDKSSPVMGTLAKRVEILVHAAYILTNVFSERIVMVAILLMRVFPTDAPVSEKIVRIFTRITSECLPSEQLHKEYSIASVAQETWLILQQRDTALYTALQNSHLPPPPRAAIDYAPAASAEAADADVLFSIPQSLICLKGWLETGFLGWLPEHAALYIWDQFTLEGAQPVVFQGLLPVLCFSLLEILREPLLANPRDADIVGCIQRKGQELKSKDVIGVLRNVLLTLPAEK